MAIMDPIIPKILAVRIIPNVHRGLAQRLKLRPDQHSLGLITCTIDDALYVSIDEGTKMADVEVVYAKSFYAGSAHASGPLSGEIERRQTSYPTRRTVSVGPAAPPPE